MAIIQLLVRIESSLNAAAPSCPSQTQFLPQAASLCSSLRGKHIISPQIFPLLPVRQVLMFFLLVWFLAWKHQKNGEPQSSDVLTQR
jgi:hypothetical protein